MDSRITELYLKILDKTLNEATTDDMFFKGRDGELKPSSDKQKERAAQKADDDQAPLTLDNTDFAAFKLLDVKDQERVKKYIQGKAHRDNVQNTFKGQDAEIEQAYRILMSSDMSSNDVESVIQDVNTNKAVDSTKLSTVGNYAPLEIFGSESNWEAYQQLMPVGVGKLQQGPGEVAFAMMSKDVDEQTKGDISINGELYELKLNGGRISDKSGPNPVLMRDILKKYFGESPVTDYFSKTQSLNTTTFARWVNKARAAGLQADFVACAEELYTHILNDEYGKKMAAAFAGDQVDPESIIKAFKEHSFDYYKSTKTGGSGAWNKLIGINTNHKQGSVAVVETGAQFANTPMQRSNPAIVRTKSGVRENYIEFKPLKG